MKRFLLTWNERVADDMGYTLHFETKTQVIEAKTEDEACDQWEKENEGNEDVNGLESCVEIVEHPLFTKNLMVQMPDGMTYAVPVETIARNRAEHFAYKNFNGDVTESLLKDTLPLFEKDSGEISQWASKNMSWSDVEREAVMFKKKVTKDEFQSVWQQGAFELK